MKCGSPFVMRKIRGVRGSAGAGKAGESGMRAFQALVLSGIALAGCSHFQGSPPQQSSKPEPRYKKAYQQHANELAKKRFRKRVRNIPTPGKVMLNAPAEPDCAAGKSNIGTQHPNDASPTAQAKTEQTTDQQGMLAARTIVEFERDCYRTAEQETREKLEELQNAVRLTKRAIKELEVK